MKTALQLYSLRDVAAAEGGERALALAAEAGFEGVEFAGFYGRTPEETAEMLAKYRLTAVSAHVGVDEIEKYLPHIEALGLACVVVPWSPCPTGDEARAFFEKMNAARELLSARGVALGYHNHAAEYAEGRDFVRELMDAVPGLFAEPDVFWLHVAGLDPAEKLREYGSRVSLVHIKEAARENPESAPEPFVGEGAIDMPAVFSRAEELGAEWAILEAEHFDCPAERYLKESIRAMKKFAADAQK